MYSVTGRHQGWDINPKSGHCLEKKGLGKRFQVKEKGEGKGGENIVKGRRHPSYTSTSKKNPSALAKRWDLVFFDVAVSAMMKKFHNSSLDCCYIQHYVGMQLAQLEQIISGCAVSTSLCLVAPFAKREVCSWLLVGFQVWHKTGTLASKLDMKSLSLTDCFFPSSPLDKGTAAKGICLQSLSACWSIRAMSGHMWGPGSSHTAGTKMLTFFNWTATPVGI